MIGSTSLLDLPDKVASLSSRRISPAAVLKCYDWTAQMRDECPVVNAMAFIPTNMAGF